MCLSKNLWFYYSLNLFSSTWRAVNLSSS